MQHTIVIDILPIVYIRKLQNIFNSLSDLYKAGRAKYLNIIFFSSSIFNKITESTDQEDNISKNYFLDRIAKFG